MRINEQPGSDANFHTLRFGMEIMGAVVRRGRIGYCALSIRDGRGVEVTQQ
jgi:hypothetical protein